MATFRGKIWVEDGFISLIFIWLHTNGVGDDLLQWLLKDLWENLQ